MKLNFYTNKMIIKSTKELDGYNTNKKIEGDRMKNWKQQIGKRGNGKM